MTEGTAREGEDQLGPVEELLRVESGDVLGREAVAAVVRQSAARFVDAKITDFVPIFAERESGGRLREKAVEAWSGQPPAFPGATGDALTPGPGPSWATRPPDSKDEAK